MLNWTALRSDTVVVTHPLELVWAPQFVELQILILAKSPFPWRSVLHRSHNHDIDVEGYMPQRHSVDLVSANFICIRGISWQ